MTLSNQHVASEIRYVLRSSISNCALHIRGSVFAVFVSLLAFVSPATCDDVEIVGGRNGLEALRVKLESEIDTSSSKDQFIKSTELWRLYIKLFPFNANSEVYLAELEETQSQLLEMGHNAKGQNTILEKGPLRDKSLFNETATAFYLGSHCYLFPNSPKSIQNYETVADAAENVGMSALELEMRARVLAVSSNSPGYKTVRELAIKAEKQNKSMVAINGLEYFQKGEYQVDGYENLNLGPSLMLSGDIYRRAHLFNQAISKYSEAIQWCGDIRLKTASRIPPSQPNEISSEKGILTFSEGGNLAKVALFEEGGILRIEDVELVRGRPFAKMLEFELATIERNANILIGRALIEDAQSKTRGESTSGFAGKLYDKAISHFSALLEPMSLNNFSAMPYRLELLRASIELARYKKSFPDGYSEAEDNYARCVSAAESYLNMVSVTRTKISLKDGEMSFLEAEAAEKVGEVAFVLIEALIEIGRKGKAFEVFNIYFAGRALEDEWAVFAMLELAVVHIENRDYLRALPFLTAISERGARLGVRDLAFVAGLMKGVCIRRLGSVKERLVVAVSRKGRNLDWVPLPRSIMANNEYGDSVEMFKSSREYPIVRYPEKYRNIFIDEIRAEVVEEFISSRDGGGLVDALSAVDPDKALGGVVASMSEFDLDKAFEKKGDTINYDDKQFAGFHASLMPTAKVVADEIDDLIGWIEGEIDNLQWNPFNERLAK